MLRDAKARMSEAADDQVWPLLEAAELPPSEAMQVGDGVGQGILHSALDAGIARLLGIELGGVGRQVGYSEVPSVCGEEGGCPMRPVRVEPIPDHQERLADLPAEVPQGQDHRRARDVATPFFSSRPVKSALVNWLPWSVLKISGLPQCCSL